MENKEKDIELIERYLKNQLGVEEKKIVESRLLDDPAFSKLEEEIRLISEGSKYAVRSEIVNQLVTLEETLQPVTFSSIPSKRRSLNWSVITGIAASLMILASLLFFFLDRQKMDLNELYAENFESYPNIVDPKLRNDTDTVINGFDYYENGNYEAAINEFIGMRENSENEFIHFYLAISYMENSQYEQALTSLNEYLKKDGPLSTQAKWYRSLCYLKMGNREEAIISLREINSESSFGNRAKSLLDQL